ncbi:MAG: 4Fe-4S ferredoxin, partial [Leptolyngbya sp. SIO3F4]|nr:4Fe-4S ferredoxin [Leptolyngbya sp. SIO3F4]
GIAYGSYARKLIAPKEVYLETQPEQLWKQVTVARELVSQLKPYIHNTPSNSNFLKHQNSLEQSSITYMPP